MKQIRFLLAILFSWLLLSSCNAPVLTASETEKQPETPSAALTADAILTQLSLQDLSLTPTLTPIPTLLILTQDSPTLTESPTPTAHPTYQYPTPIPCDTAGFVEDVTIHDGTEIEAGATFTKTWRLRNDGTCTWSSEYEVVFSSGDSMGGPDSQEFTSDSISPGETVDISVDLTAPSDPGNYIGYWKLKNASGSIFGIGSYNYPFFVEINVVEVQTTMTPTPTPTDITEITATMTLTPTFSPTDTIEVTATPTLTQVEASSTPTDIPTETNTPAETP